MLRKARLDLAGTLHHIILVSKKTHSSPTKEMGVFDHESIVFWAEAQIASRLSNHRLAGA